MFFVFFGLWIIFCGAVTVELIWIGLLVSGLVYAFFCKFIGYSPKKELTFFRKIGQGLLYVVILVYEIIVANFHVMYLILTSKYEVEPVILHFRTDLKTDLARVVLANSITLTPGTITVTVEQDEYCVHCLDKELAEGMLESRFVRLLHRMEQ